MIWLPFATGRAADLWLHLRHRICLEVFRVSVSLLLPVPSHPVPEFFGLLAGLVFGFPVINPPKLVTCSRGSVWMGQY